MEKLKRVALSFTLTSILAVAVFAGENSPPCVPGETGSPPCSSRAMTDGSIAPGENPATPASESLDVISIADAALWSLTLF